MINPSPAPIRAGNLVMHFGKKPYIMGILNVTPDSFSDGGRFFDHEKAVEKALKMVEEGADILDVGGESTRPGSDPVDAREEIRRVIPVIEKVAGWTAVPISIDTTKAMVAEEALSAGACMVNDVSALHQDPQMAEVVAEKQVPLVLMHMRGVPKTMQAESIVYRNLLGEINEFLYDSIARATRFGIPRELLIVDPGIGFGKTVEHNLCILAELERLRELGRPVLIGASRKAFMGKLLDLDVGERVYATAAVSAIAVLHGAHILRVHDVKPMRQAADMAHAISTVGQLNEDKLFEIMKDSDSTP